MTAKTLACPICRRHGYYTTDGLAGHLDRDHTPGIVAQTLAEITNTAPTIANAGADLAVDAGPCPSGKVRYETEHDARVELCGAVVAKNRGRNRRRETRAYSCPRCDGWHLTSLPLVGPAAAGR
jgi:hypothetical protein